MSCRPASIPSCRRPSTREPLSGATGSATAPPIIPASRSRPGAGRRTTVSYLNNLPLQPSAAAISDGRPDPPLGRPLWSRWVPSRPIAGPPPIVTHLHGGEVPSAFDGHPESWFTPGRAKTGQASRPTSTPIPMRRQAATLWFHDHALGITRLNVYAGLAAFYLIRDAYDTGVAGTGLDLPSGKYEVELAIQDRQFDTNGQLFFPAGRTGGPERARRPTPRPTRSGSRSSLATRSSSTARPGRI